LIIDHVDLKAIVMRQTFLATPELWPKFWLGVVSGSLVIASPVLKNRASWQHGNKHRVVYFPLAFAWCYD